LVDTFRETESAELAIILGNESPGGGWSRGVGESVFDEIFDTMARFTGWDQVGWWEDYHQYAYMVGSTPVVTKVRMCKDLTTSHGVDHAMSTVEMKLLNYGRAKACVRSSTVVDADTLPDTVSPSRVKILKQKTFSRHPWKFVFTKVWSGDNRTDAELQQSKGNLVYNVEIVFTPGHGYWDLPNHSSSYVATSMLMKMVDILSSEMFHVEPLTIN
jgi:hypothetical protein